MHATRLLMGGAVALFGHAAVMQAQGEVGVDDIVVTTAGGIGTYAYGGQRHLVYAALHNESPDLRAQPERWQFRFVPLMVPQVTRDGSVFAYKASLPDGAVRVFIPIALATPTTAQSAFQTVQGAYPAQAGKIRPSSVTPLAVREITFSWPDLQVRVPRASLVTTSVPLGPVTPETVTLMVDAPSDEVASRVLALVPVSRLLYTLRLSARAVRRNLVEVTWDDVRVSRLATELKGDAGGRKNYVHRDDVRDLATDLSRVVAQRAIIEDPLQFAAGIAERALTLLAPSEAMLSKLDEAARASTFNVSDLSPDVLTRTLNKMFTKDQGKTEDEWKATAEGSGKAGILGVLSAEASAKGSFDSRSLREWLRQHDIEADIQGNMIVVKDVYVRQVNHGAFTSKGLFSSVSAFVREVNGDQSGTIELARHSQAATGAPTMAERLAIVERESAPLGTIIASVLPPERFSTLVGQGVWMLADGGAVPIGSRYATEIGPTVPDLRGMFVRGMNAYVAGRERNDGLQDPDGVRAAGSVQRDAVGPFKTRLEVFAEIGHSNGGNGSPHRIMSEDGPSWANAAYPTTASCVSGCAPETRPRNVAVYYYVRVQ